MMLRLFTSTCAIMIIVSASSRLDKFSPFRRTSSLEKDRVLKIPSQLLAFKAQYPRLNIRSAEEYFVKWEQNRSDRQIIQPGVYSCGHQGSETFLNFVNPHFPDTDLVSGTCHFRVLLNHQDVCQVRIDFVNTEMLSPSTKGECDDQFMTVTGKIWPIGIKSFCGINSDQHFYIHLKDDKGSGGKRFVDIAVTTVRANKAYKFGLWITQINCNRDLSIQAPPGCSQHFVGGKGSIKSFNFQGLQYFSGQELKICIRPNENSCALKFEAESNHFLISNDPGSDKCYPYNSQLQLTSKQLSGSGDGDCSSDFLLIPNATKYRMQHKYLTDARISKDRFCGGKLNSLSRKNESHPLFVPINSNLIWIQFITGSNHSNLKTTPLGYRIQYTQIKCSTND